jgi:hypothetical protein
MEMGPKGSSTLKSEFSAWPAIVPRPTRQVAVASLLLACLLVPACGSGGGSSVSGSGSPAAGAQPAASLPAKSGSVGGTFTASGGMSAELKPDAAQPPQCDPGNTNLRLNVVAADGTRYQFSLSATKTGTVSLPATAADALSIDLHNQSDSSTGQAWVGSGTTLTGGTAAIAADYQSGSLDVTVPADPRKLVQPVHLVGTWRCH